MRGRLARIWWLGLKEILSLRRDVAMVVLLIWAFFPAVYVDATGKTGSVNNASIAVADEDRSALSRSLMAGFRRPEFQPAQEIAPQAADAAMDAGTYLFVVSIPPGFEADLAAGRAPEIQVLVDATAMEQAGLGAGYIANILSAEIARFLSGRERVEATPAIRLVTRSAFNPNRDPVLFQAVTSVIGHISILSVILTGAALIREREHGTLEHLLAMPLSPFEIAAAKIWANGAVVLVAALVSTLALVEGVLGLRVAGSHLLFVAGTAAFLFSTTALGLFLATLARSMAQFALLFFLVILPMQLLSGSETPIEGQPDWLQPFTLLLPSRHFVALSQAVIFKGAGLETVWPQFAALALLGAGLLGLSLSRFRTVVAQER